MSHIVTIKTEVRDVEAVRAACRRQGLEEPVHGTFGLYSGEATGLAIKLTAWLYPVVFDMAAGQVKYDNYEGHWGDQKHLDRFLQLYAVEKARVAAHLAREQKSMVCLVLSRRLSVHFDATGRVAGRQEATPDVPCEPYAVIGRRRVQFDFGGGDVLRPIDEADH